MGVIRISEETKAKLLEREPEFQAFQKKQSYYWYYKFSWDKFLSWLIENKVTKKRSSQCNKKGSKNVTKI